MGIEQARRFGRGLHRVRTKGRGELLAFLASPAADAAKRPHGMEAARDSEQRRQP